MLSVSEQNLSDYSNPYSIFKYSIRNELTRRYYERRLHRFFDYVGFLPDVEIEKRCDCFAQSGKKNPNWVLNKIIFFLQYQKERSVRGEITPATLGNFVKAIKLQSGKKNPNWVLNKIIFFLQYQKERSVRGEITPATLGNFVKAIKLFCEMSDIQVPWKKITRGLPRVREAANDRAPTIEEIKKLIEYPDRTASGCSQILILMVPKKNRTLLICV